MEFLGYIGALIIGTTLGLVGGGGSILTVPVLVYFFDIPPVLATAYSLFVVGVSSVVGTAGYIRKGLLNFKTALIFAIPSFIAVYSTRHFLLPQLPSTLPLATTSSYLQDILFALVLLGALIATAFLLRRYPIHTNENSTFKVVLLMVPAASTVFIVRQYLLPNLPEVLFANQTFHVSKDSAIMILFSIIMALASFSMIRPSKNEPSNKSMPTNFTYPLIVFEGALVGTVTGIVGAGGGFLIIPALVILAKLPMKYAVGTSLLIISIKSLIGFLGDLGHQEINWPFLLKFSSLSILGIFLGSSLSNYVSGEKLKRSFGYFVLLMALILLGKQFL